MARNDESLDVVETDYVAGGSGRPVEDTQVHAASDSQADELAPAAAAPVRRHASEPVPNVRASVRAVQEVEAERAAIEASRRLPTGLLATLVGAATVAFGLQVLVLVLVGVAISWPSTAPAGPDEVDGVPIRERLGDR